MEAQTVYIKVWRLALKPAANMSNRRIQELNAGIGELRQLLSCVVCRELLNDPYQPARRRCNHHVCRLCLRGRKRLIPGCRQCNDCNDYKTYKENKSMAWQVLCYRTLCRHLQNSLLFAQLAGHRPSSEVNLHDRMMPRIELPDESTQWFIHEGANYIDMYDTFLPDQLSLKDIPSLPSETPPTTAATTPELPYEQQMPEQLSITDIELEAAATGDQAHFAHPLPIISSNARLLSHSHIVPQAQHVVMPAAQPIMTAGYIEPAWSEQVDLSAAFTLPTANYSFVLPSNEMQIGQMVQLPAELSESPFESVNPSTSIAASSKRRHVELVDEDWEDEDDQPLSQRHQKATIFSAVQLKPPMAATKATETAKITAIMPSTTSVKATATTTATPLPAVLAMNTSKSETVTSSKKTKASADKVSNRLEVEKNFCRCGSTTVPNLMTCRNSRCVCYLSGYKCVDCFCQGCKNPHRYTGGESSDSEFEADVKEEEPTSNINAVETPAAPMQTGYTLVPLENLQQSQHPLVLIQNENGQLQGFNIFIGSEPIDPAQAGFQRVPLRSNDGNSTIPQFAYVPQTAAAPPAPPTTTVVPPTIPAIPPKPLPAPPVKKSRINTRMQTRAAAAECALSTDELLGGVGGAKSKAAADAGKAHALFEDIMSGSDDL